MCALTAENRCNGGRWVWINASPHANGPTVQLAQHFLQHLAPQHLTRIDCFDRAPLPCDDCRYCHTHERCAKRDIDDIYQAIEQADGLLFALPVYHNSFPAPAKALIDRFQRYWAARFVRNQKPPIAKAKQAVLLSVSGSDGAEGGMLVQAQLQPPLTVLHATLVASLHLRGADKKGITPFDLEQAERLADKVKNA